MPHVLERQPLERLPRLGVLAWLLATISVIGSWLAASWMLANHPEPLDRALGVGLVGAVGARLVWVSLRTWWATRTRRARHTDAAAILGRHDPELGVVVLDSPQPAAYCLPRSGGGLVVVTTGTTSMLSARQLRAVLAHERAHLDGRHHALLGLGQALSQTFPSLRLFRQLGGQVHRLLEMHADDAAARVHGRRTVAAAIALMSDATNPSGAMGMGGPTAYARVLRLVQVDRRPGPGSIGLVLTAIILAAGPFLATLPHCPHPW